MADSFSFNGSLFMPKGNNKHSSYEEKSNGKADIKTLSFACNTPAGVQFLRLNYAKSKNEEKIPPLYLMDSSNKKLVVPFKERFNPEYTKQVPNYLKFILDTETNPKRRQEMRKILSDYKDKLEEIPQETLQSVGCNTVEDLKKAYKQSLSKRKSFLSQWDYIDAVLEAFENNEFKEGNFRINGRININHGEKYDFVDYIPYSITSTSDEISEPATARVNVFFDQNALMETDEGFQLNGFLEYWYKSPVNDKGSKQYSPYSIMIPLDTVKPELIDKVKNKYRSIFHIDSPSEVRELGLIVDMVNGSVKKKLTIDDLDEEQRELVEFGLLDLQEALDYLGGAMRSEVVKANIFKKIQPNFIQGAKPAAVGADKLGFFDPALETDDFVDFEDGLPF